MFERVLAHRRTTLIVLGIAVFAFALIAGLTLRVDNSPDIWLPAGDTELDHYRRFKERFGSDAVVGLVSGPLDLGAQKIGEQFAALSEELRRMDGIASLASPFGTDGELRHGPLATPLLGKSGKRVVLFARLDDGIPHADRKNLITALEDSGRDHPELGPFTIVGTDVVTRDLDRGSERSFGGLFPLVAASLALVIFYALRSWRMLVAILLAALASAIASIGTLAAFGSSLNLLLVLMPAILVVLTVAAAIHLCSRYLDLVTEESQETQAHRDELWRRAIRATQRPCALTTATTAIGFASLGVSEVGPVRDLGWFTAIGSIWAFVFVFTLVPALVSRRAVPSRAASKTRSTQAVEGYVRWLGRRRRTVFAIATVFAGLACASAARLRVESNVLEFFAADHELPRAYRDFEAEFFGLTSFEIWLEGEAAAVAAPGPLAALTALRDFGLKGGWITGSLSPLGALEDAPLLVRDALYAKMIDDPPPAATGYIWRDEDRAALRTTFTATTTSSNAANDAVEALRAERDRIALADGVTMRISGSAPLLVRGQVLLLDTQIRSFLTALALITLVVFAVFRSLRLTLLSIVTNALPIAGTLGVMGWLNIRLDAGTVTVAGIALGLVIDDTIHLLYGYSERSRQAPLQRLEGTLRAVGKPVLITSTAVALGFGLFAFASFQPTKYFGLLVALTSVFALIADLVLLPAMLSPRYPRAARDDRPS